MTVDTWVQGTNGHGGGVSPSVAPLPKLDFFFVGAGMGFLCRCSGSVSPPTIELTPDSLCLQHVPSIS